MRLSPLSALLAPLLLFCLSPGTALGQDDPGADVVYVAVEWDEGDSPESWSLTGFKCVDVSLGCPAGTVFVDAPLGNVSGCTPVGGSPPTSCDGQCTICSGQNIEGRLCKKGLPIETCDSAGSGALLNCGKQARVNCGTGGTNAGPNGCSCPPPADYPPNTDCKVQQCQ
ncbi:MAG TPA: hypothetical protein VD963_02060 [Phycisphaerales bacterium]|nr:hypothetical protein [Phycisphaerales bacterium]